MSLSIKYRIPIQYPETEDCRSFIDQVDFWITVENVRIANESIGYYEYCGVFRKDPDWYSLTSLDIVKVEFLYQKEGVPEEILEQVLIFLENNSEFESLVVQEELNQSDNY